MAKLKTPKGLNGPEGLILAVMARTIGDCLIADNDPELALSAWAYMGTTYSRHLELLDRDEDSWPVLLDQIPDDELIRIVETVEEVIPA